jgi:hypothetical protein
MNAKDWILCGMISMYLVPIVAIGMQYRRNNKSVSSIIGKTDRRFLLYPMMVMCLLSLLYECVQFNGYCFASILVLVVGLLGVMTVDESNTLHYVFAFLCFGSILFYCLYCCLLFKIVYVIGIILLILSFSLGDKMMKRKSIFWEEVSIILLFAGIYLWKHFARVL